MIIIQTQSTTALSPLDVSAIKTVGSVVLSDDGETAAYTLRVYPDPLKKNAPASSEIHVLDISSGEARPFMTRSSAAQVQFRPEHNSLTFLGRLGGDKTTTLYEIPLNGGEAIPVFSFETSIRSYE